MSGFYSLENISKYTKEQCEEYLAAHPNGLRSDIVRERLRVLSPDNEDDASGLSHKSSFRGLTNNNQGIKDSDAYPNEGKANQPGPLYKIKKADGFSLKKSAKVFFL